MDNGTTSPTPAPKIKRNANRNSIVGTSCGPIPPIKYITKLHIISVRFVSIDVRKLDKKEKGMIKIEGAVNINLIIVGLASGNVFAMSPRAREIAAPAMTVAIEIDI